MIKKTSLFAQGVCFLGGVTCGEVGVVFGGGVVFLREEVEVFRRLLRRLLRCLGEVWGSI